MNILGWFTGGVIGSLTGPLERAYKARLEAQNDAQRIDAEKQIEFYKGQIELATVAAQHDKWWSTRELIGKCAALYVFKIVVWDTVLGLGVTPDPGPQVTGIVMLVLGFYFGSKAATDIATRLLSAFASRKR